VVACWPPRRRSAGTRRQLAATVAWQSTTAAFAGGAVGVPVGIALGRFLWTLFACQISVCLANLVAAVPGCIAGRTPAAASLRAE